MPDKCQSCGASAVIEDDIGGGGIQRICIECGTIDSGVKIEAVIIKTDLDIKNFPLSDTTQENWICESCGDSLSPGCLQAGSKVCPECQELEADQAEVNEELAPTLPESCSKYEKVLDPISTTKICKSCGSSNLCMDSLGADERLVCRDCGTVAGGEALTNDEFQVVMRKPSQNFLTLPRNANQPKKLQGRVAGHQKIAFLHNKLCFPDYVKEEALEMFDQVLVKPRVYYTRFATKEHMAAACVFIVCRQHDIPVSLLHFRKYVERFPLFLKSWKIVVKYLNITLPHMTLSCQVENLLSNHGFSNTIVSKVNDILFLCRQAWLTQGRSREGLIIIATYYAYLSSDKCSGFISMAKFRKQFNFPKISLGLQAECNNMFLKLANSIPWLPGKRVTAATVYKYIDDILKFQNSLFHLAFRQNDSRMMDGNIPETTQELPSRNMNDIKRKTTEKEALLPSILKKPRKKIIVVEPTISPSIDLDSPDVKESEFDEDEISSYLLSPEEQANLRMPKLMFMKR